MPRTAANEPETLRPYLFHGVGLRWREGDKQAIAECPFCGREEKFSVSIKTGEFRCFGCNEGQEKGKPIRGGNVRVFIRLLHEKSFEATSPADYRELANERGLVHADTLVAWELGKSLLTGDWLLPGYNVERKLTNLYRYLTFTKDGIPSRRFVPTTGLGHQMHGLNLFDPSKPVIDVCEGPWDGIAWWEVLGNCKWGESGLALTANREASLLASRNIIAVPGCETFLEPWLPLFADKEVNLLFDNDHERVHPKTAQAIPAAGYRGMERVAKILASSQAPPLSVRFLAWHPTNGWDPSLPSGYDLRDLLTK